MNAKEKIASILRNPKEYIENLVKITTKNSSVENLKFNYMQNKVYETIKDKTSIKVIVLKARQHGISTLVDAMGFNETATKKNRVFAIVTHEEKATSNLFNRMKFIYDNLPKWAKPTIKYSNAKDLVFQSDDPNLSMNSKIKCYTAGATEIGRSETINFLHLSELAFWNENTALNNYTSIMQAVPKDNSKVVIESTANGYNLFKDLWDDAVQGKNDLIPIFIAWFENPEYTIQGELPSKSIEEQELQRLYNLTDEQLKWRRWCIANNCGNDLNKFHQEYPASPEEAFISSGNPIFDNEKIIKRIEVLRQLYLREPYIKGSFFNKVFKENVNNFIKIYYKPILGSYYVIGVDTAGEGSDNYGITVIDNTTGKRVATMWCKIPANEIADQLEALGYYYNTALINIEINFNIYLIEELKRRNYPKQYVRKIYDSYTGKHKDTFGWRTDGNTRQFIITTEQVLINEHIELFTDIDMLNECITFVRDKSGRPDAISGKHDDLLFSDMIAQAGREQQNVIIKKIDLKSEFYNFNVEKPSHKDWGETIKVI